MNNPKAELRKYLDRLIHRYLNIKSLHQQLKSIFEWETPARIEALNLGAYFFQLVTYSLLRTVLIELSHRWSLLRAIVMVLLLGTGAGCATTSTSTGMMTTLRARQPLPPGIPSRVGVIPFQGNSAISLQATDQFSSGLPVLGFEVVERSQIESVLAELNFQQTGSVDPATRERLAKQLGLQGVFLGSITGESSALWVDSHLNVRLVSVETGSVMWAVEAHDPRAMSWSRTYAPQQFTPYGRRWNSWERIFADREAHGLTSA